MSLISEALNKAQRQRALEAAPQTDAPSSRTFRRRPRITALKSFAFVWGNVTALTLVAVAVIYFRARPAVIEPVASLPQPAAPLAPAPRAVPPAASPFIPPAETPIAATVASTEYDLAGVTTLGADTLLSVSRRSDRHSIWIAVGKTIGDITAVSYEPNSDRAVIRVGDRLVRISIRTGSGEPGTAPPVGE